MSSRPRPTNNRPGRPPIDPAEVRGERVMIRLTAAELAEIEAASAGGTVSEWARGVLLRAARRQR